MKLSVKEELLKIFFISLAMIACSTMIYMLRTPSLTGSVVLEPGSSTTVMVVIALILAAIAVVLGAIAVIHKLKKELEGHKKTIAEKPIDENDLDVAAYILKARQNNFTDVQISARLKEMGWDPKEIKKFL